MFELLFKYPPTVFAKGRFVLLGGWPLWAFAACVLATALALAWQMRRNGTAFRVRWGRPAIWLLETLFLSLVLLLLWRPAMSIASLKPQENIVAVLVDDSRSMGIREDGKTRLESAAATLNGGLLSELGKKFQVRLYRFGGQLQRFDEVRGLTPLENSTRIGDALKQIAAEATSLPIGAVVLLSDGADNAGGVDLDTIAQMRRIPVHTIGFGRETPAKDVEVSEAVVPARALLGSRLSATVTLTSHGLKQKARLAVRDAGKVLAVRDVALKDGEQEETLLFNAGAAGARTLEIAVEPIPGEENTRNNAVTRLVNVEAVKPHALYMEGEPRWEYKFIRRAIEADDNLQLVSIVRTTQNKIYRQGIANDKELAEGFPSKAEELFAYQALILGSVESGYFSQTQQELIRDFVDRRGGGLLFLGGRAALADGGYARAPFLDLLPVALPERKGTFHRDPAFVELTAAGRESMLTRLLEDPDANVERWKKLPVLADFQEIGAPKPGASVLAQLTAARYTQPLLVTQNYGRGRTAVFATGGSWRWKMLLDHTDVTHQTFWQQLVRWLVSGTPGQVVTSTPRQVLADDGHITLAAEVRDKSFRPVSDARVEARIMGPAGFSETAELQPKPQELGSYALEWNAAKAGSYLAEVVAKHGETEIGRDVTVFRREDGVAEDFRTGQNRELLARLSSQTGGRYYRPSEAAKLGREVQYSEAGITLRETRDLWDMPVVFLLALALRSTEWLLRRRWGVI